MRKILFIFALCVSILFISQAVIAACPDNANTDSEFRNILRKSLVHFLTNASTDKITGAQLKDLLVFYIKTEDWSTADCYSLGNYSSEPIVSIVSVADSEILDSYIPNCSDGTYYGECASSKPYYCDLGSLIQKCGYPYYCGCPSGYFCNGNICESAPSEIISGNICYNCNSPDNNDWCPSVEGYKLTSTIPFVNVSCGCPPDSYQGMISTQYSYTDIGHQCNYTACDELWNCTSWSTCLSGNESRNCVDSNSCGTVFDKPDIFRSCSDSSITCVDSDGGLNYTIKGYAVGPESTSNLTKTYTDTCLNITTIKEGRCSSGYVAWSQYSCLGSCSSGVCI